MSNRIDDPKVKATWTHETGWVIHNQISELTVGVYKLPTTGEIFVVKPNREKTRLYAKKLVPAASKRLTASGKEIPFDYVYQPGAIFQLKPEMKLSFEEAKALSIQYGYCIVCGRGLKVAESVERGIGPVCAKVMGSPRKGVEKIAEDFNIPVDVAKSRMVALTKDITAKAEEKKLSIEDSDTHICPEDGSEVTVDYESGRLHLKERGLGAGEDVDFFDGHCAQGHSLKVWND